MNNLTVFSHDNIDVIESREVARSIDKRHADLLESIKGYVQHLANGNFRSLDFFIESSYMDNQNKSRPCYLLTKKGCDMVANKMTGEKGVLFTAAYVNAFEEMREHIQTGKPLPDTIKQALAEAKLNNSRARLASAWLKIADNVMLPNFKQVCASYASNALAGHEVIALPQSEQKNYSATEIGEMFGITKQRVGSIAVKHNLKVDEYGAWYHDKSPYSNKEFDTFRYNDAAIERFKEILGVPDIA